MAKAYYASRISDHMAETPNEGYLICHAVPIARTGPQEYTPAELKIEADGMIAVDRLEQDVFAPATIASFEGKAVTDDHPSDFVTSENHGDLARGHASNVRRGTGDKSDLLLADLVITDKALIEKIKAGKREVSCGYYYRLEEVDGSYLTRDIVGNHIAVVDFGRAGDRVKIMDKKTERKEKRMSLFGKGKKKTGVVAGLMKYLAANDADPEEFEAAVEALAEPDTAAENAVESKVMAEMMGEIKKLREEVARLAAAEKKEVEEQSEMDCLEAELIKEEKGEDEEMVVVEPGEVKEEKIIGADKAAVLATIRAVKPVIAGITDKADQKKAADAMAKALRSVMGTTSTQKANYADLGKGKAVDTREDLDRKYFEKMRAMNPHLKKEGK